SYAADGCPDQPRLGFSDSTVVLAADIFSRCDDHSGLALGSRVWVVNKAELLAGSTTPALATFGPERGRRSLAPVQSLSPTATEYAVATDEPPTRVVHLLAVDGVPPAAVSLREIASPAIRRLSDPPFAAQPAGAG